jgi:hypothetical protein
MWKGLVRRCGFQEDSPHSGIPSEFHIADIVAHHQRPGKVYFGEVGPGRMGHSGVGFTEGVIVTQRIGLIDPVYPAAGKGDFRYHFIMDQVQVCCRHHTPAYASLIGDNHDPAEGRCEDL